MHALYEMWKWHPFISGSASIIVCNAAITALPSPDKTDGKFYKWFFTFTHLLVGAWMRIAQQIKNENFQSLEIPNLESSESETKGEEKK